MTLQRLENLQNVCILCASVICLSYTSYATFNVACDVITVEIEHVDTVTLDELVVSGKDVQPSPETIRIIQVTITICIMLSLLN